MPTDRIYINNLTYQINKCTCGRCGKFWKESKLVNYRGDEVHMSAANWRGLEEEARNITYHVIIQRETPFCHGCFNPETEVKAEIKVVHYADQPKIVAPAQIVERRRTPNAARILSNANLFGEAKKPELADSAGGDNEDRSGSLPDPNGVLPSERKAGGLKARLQSGSEGSSDGS